MSGSVPAGDCGRFRVQFLQCRIRLDTNQNLPQPRGSHRICVSLQDTTTVPATALLPICRFRKGSQGFDVAQPAKVACSLRALPAEIRGMLRSGNQEFIREWFGDSFRAAHASYFTSHGVTQGLFLFSNSCVLSSFVQRWWV